jgi:hypothetical protein
LNFWQIVILFNHSSILSYYLKAIAMLQALAEFHFFRPYHLLNDPRLSKHDRSIRALNEFQTFWEYGVPRIGDTTSSAEGWASFNATETNKDEWIDDECL